MNTNKCRTIGCASDAAGMVRWWDADTREWVTERVCADCGESYSRRPALRAEFRPFMGA